MKASNLQDAWAPPDNTRLTPKQFSFRLPVHVAAKIAAQEEMYPQKSRTQLIADLLISALDELERSLPEALGAPVDTEEQHYERMAMEQIGEEFVPSFHLGGPRGTFRDLANKHFYEQEGELGNEKPAPLFKQLYVTEQQFQK